MLLKWLTLAPFGLLLGHPPAVHAAEERALAFCHTHTGERLEIAYFARGEYQPAALSRVDRLLRDFRTGETHPIDPRLLDTLNALCAVCGGGVFEIISGYRSVKTNAMLRQAAGGVAAHSLHLEGRAIDVRLTGFRTARLRDAAIALGRGGVGYYPGSDFVHLDTGRVRNWGPHNV
ncbi:MAG: DUF882 domain-containing protein [Betaproteobacteria bacterium]|nr:DUF882 domain-containing protein [Betaproteobacteria bacterium]